MTQKIAIVHYQPLEFYPPTTNFLNIAAEINSFKFFVFSTRNNKGRKIYYNAKIHSIYRGPGTKVNDIKLVRFIKYVIFNLYSLLCLIKVRPNKIVYFESYSAWPVYWYLKYFGEKVDLYIHHHEYFDPDWYKKGMKLLKKYNKYEKEFLYPRATWISQTNSDRINLFLEDNKEVCEKKMHVLPNFPPKGWAEFRRFDNLEYPPLKIVYVGSLSISSTYIIEFCNWVIAQRGKVIFDIYTYNLHKNTKDYLDNLQNEYINFHGEGVEYDELPVTLSNFQIGVILYKGLSKNFIYNAPNKLFEYLACGLTVLYSDTMFGIDPYNSENVIPINFEKMKSVKAEDLMGLGINGRTKHYFAEDVLDELLESLKS